MKLSYVGCLLAVLNIAAAVHAADELDAVEAQMKARWDSFKSMSYDMESKTDSSTDQFTYKADSTGSAEMVKSGENKWKMHSESKTTSIQKLPGQAENKTEATSLVVSDGVTMYSYTESAGQKSATKMKVPETQAVAGDSFFKSMRQTYNLKLLADESVDGVACWVVEATYKQEIPGQQPMKFYISKDNAMTVQTEMKGPGGKVMSLTKIKNVKLNASIPDDHFVFTAPAGVTVVDADAANAAALQQAAAAQAAAAKAQQDAAAAKKDEPAKTDTAAKSDTAASEPAKKDEPAKTDEPKKKEPSTKSKVKKGFGL